MDRNDEVEWLEAFLIMRSCVTRSRMRWCAVLLLTAFMMNCRSAGDRPSSADRPPNIVIFFSDDMGYSHLGSYEGE